MFIFGDVLVVQQKFMIFVSHHPLLVLRTLLRTQFRLLHVLRQQTLLPQRLLSLLFSNPFLSVHRLLQIVLPA